MPQPNLRRQLALWLLFPLLGLLALDTWLTYQRAMSAANSAFDRSLEFSIKSIREGTQLIDGEVQVNLPYLALEMFESDRGGKIYYVIREGGDGVQGGDNDGRAVTGYHDLPLPSASVTPEPYHTAFYDATYRGETLRMGALQLPVHDVPNAKTRVVWIVVGETTEARHELARQILTGALQQEVLLVVLALAIVWLGVTRGLRPLNRLSAKVAAREEDDTTPLENVDLPTEVKPLVESINQYVGRVGRMQASRQRFFADAAHQLKTPLAIIQAESELTLRESLSAQARERVERLNQAVKQAAKSVRQLLSLSRLEAEDGPPVAMVPTRLDEAARSVTLDWSPVARSRGIDLGFENDGAVTVLAQRELLAELCGNLIDNAIRYAGDGAMITVRTQRGRKTGQVDGVDVATVAQTSNGTHDILDGPMLQVVDNGPGIPAHERDAVFERFYRRESAALTQSTADGSGLGLAIVKEIARKHHAVVSLGEAPGGGLEVTVRFPANEAA
ncbi:sensor histidine kinase N-terminal domain-containing protein [Pandoraea sputorum]|uniref:sensor histidine kinase n=1 Tax=Pandoraea sputorum TaxID=93222 RepID=UPI001E535351|nr:sensor histidine kinase [Pandoraea sputorum]MCE4061033.1 sensor histidine kinase N-terminal domain-containing protein [Pandoraea sputorum]